MAKNGEKVETVADFIFLGSKITADDDCSHEVKRCLLLGKKPMTNLDNGPPALGGWRLSHWITREVPILDVLYKSLYEKRA